MERVVFDEDFGFRKRLEDRYPEIRAEWERLPWSELREWPQPGAYRGQWGVFGFFIARRRLECNCRICPETARLLETVPGLFTAGFSVLGPDTYLPPHRGERDDMLRCHLGIVIPENCAIRLGGRDHEWSAGKTFVFDDLAEHEAWNRSDRHKIVLLIDFDKPWNELVTSDDSQDERDRRFYDELFPDWT